MATFNKFNPFVEHLAEGAHNLGTGTLKVALCSTSAAPVATNAKLADLTVVNVASVIDNVTLTTTSSAQASGTYKLKLADLTMTATGGNASFGHIVIYNDSATTPTDALIGWYNYGSQLALTTGESLLVDFSTSQVLLTIA